MNWPKCRDVYTAKAGFYSIEINRSFSFFFWQKPVIPFPHFTECPALRGQLVLTLLTVSLGIYSLPLNRVLHLLLEFSLLGIISGLPAVKTVPRSRAYSSFRSHIHAPASISSSSLPTVKA